MKFESLEGDVRDTGRTKRLAQGYALALLVLAGLLTVGAVFGGEIKRQVFEEDLDVKFAKSPKAEPPPPPPPPPPPAMKARIAPPAPGPAALGNSEAPPKEMPKDLPPEGDPNKAKTEVEYDPNVGAGDPRGKAGGKGGGGAPPKVEVVDAGPVTAPEPPPAPPVVTQEDVIAPVPLEKPMPAYPKEARVQGIEAIIVVSYWVEVDGSVSDVRVMPSHGHPLFDAAVLESVRAWKFTPASLEGKPLRMRRQSKIPFKLRTQ